MKKTIGTAVPLLALWSDKKNEKHGNLDTALLFLDWLHTTGQTAWQLLPLHETQLVPGSKKDHVPSPYKGYGVGLDPKYLSTSLKKIKPSKQDISSFSAKQKKWLPNYALFCALRDHFGTDDWTKWDSDIRSRDSKAVVAWRNKLKKQIHAHVLKQWQLHHGFQKLRDKAKKYNIHLIGDLSFYIPLQSPLVWEFQNLFQLTERGCVKKISGLPDGPKSHFGRQVWGHPLYNWENKKIYRELTKLWKIRLKYLSSLLDWVRLDHARGFFSYGSIDSKDDKKDCMKQGPGESVFNELIVFTKACGLKIFAEDLGSERKNDRLRDFYIILKKLKIPGIRILRYALTIRKGENLHPQYADVSAYPKNTVACTTTHDSETLMGYLKILSAKQKKILAKEARAEFSTDDITLAINLRKAVINSPAHCVIIPIQDWLLTTDRINIPGTEKMVGDTNWKYRVSASIENLPFLKSTSKYICNNQPI